MAQRARSTTRLPAVGNAVMAAVRLESGLPFHVQIAKMQGATRDEVISAVLIGLPAVGNAVTAALPVALEAYDQA